MGRAKPKLIGFDPRTGLIQRGRKTVRRLSDLRALFHERELVEQMLRSGEDPVVYEVYEAPQPPLEGFFSVAWTVLYPGKVGKEYFFTKGHFHAREPRGEVYLGLQGSGKILMQSREGEVKLLPLARGKLVNIPPGWAHRTINTGRSKLTFLSIYPSDAGHDYGAIKRSGFARLVVERGGKPVLVKNPRFKP